MSEVPLKRRALKGALWSAVGGNGAQALGFVMFLVISRMVGPEAFGVVAVCLLLIELTRGVAIESVAVNLVAIGRFDARAFDAGLLITGAAAIVVTLALIATAPLLSMAFSMPSLTEVLPKVAPLLLVLAASRLVESELTLRMAFRGLATRSLGAVALGGACGIAAAFSGWGVDALVLQQWVSAVAALSFLALQTHWRPSLPNAAGDVRTLALDSATLAPAQLISSLRLTIDGLAVATFSGATAAGLYNLAKRARLALQLGVTASIGRVALPTFGQIKHDQTRTAHAANQAMRLGSIVAFPVFIGVAAIAPELVYLLLGPTWAGAATPMTLLLIGGALSSTTGLCESLMLIQGRRSAIVALQGAIVLLLIVLIAVVGRHGPIAIASVVIVANAVHNIAAWRLAGRELRLRWRDYLANVWAPFAISVAMLGLIVALRTLLAQSAWPHAVQLALFICSGAVFYVAMAWLTVRPAMLAALDAARVVLKPTN